jgi:hypothetical protein
MKTYIAKLKQVAVIAGITLSGIGASGAVIPANALTFNFTPGSGMSQQAIDGFTAAGNRWAALFTDNVTINIDINFTDLGQTRILAQAGSTRQDYTYNQVYNALNNDRTSTDDNKAVASLSSNSAFNMLLNRTSNNPNGFGSANPYLDNDGDANNRSLNISNANAKALGLATTGNSDASISFNSNILTGFTWDFNPNDGINPGDFDFVGLATHEIGHALGFTSGVDVLDFNGPFVDPQTGQRTFFRDDQFTFVNTLDLFRYSDLSNQNGNGGAIDWTADPRDKYFSLDKGLTKIASFSTGRTWGDGNQASHWKDLLGLGILDPTAARGELLKITENDLMAFDVIGWDRRPAITSTAVPEPANFIGTFICAAFGVKMVLKRRQKLSESIEIATTEEI